MISLLLILDFFLVKARSIFEELTDCFSLSTLSQDAPLRFFVAVFLPNVSLSYLIYLGVSSISYGITVALSIFPVLMLFNPLLLSSLNALLLPSSNCLPCSFLLRSSSSMAESARSSRAL